MSLDTNMDFHSTVPQTSPMSVDQVQNNAGGYGWKIDDMLRLKRFLCLGSEKGTFYVSEKKLTEENARSILRLIQTGRGLEVVSIVKQFSDEGRAAKQRPILFALALCARSEDLPTKQAAYKVLNDICRIPTFLFEFISLCESLRESTGWGRAHRNAISGWYNKFTENPMKLAMHVTKYKNRNDWSHKDVLRLAHTVPKSEAVGASLRFCVKGLEEAQKMYDKDDLPADSPVKKVLVFLAATEQARVSESPQEVIELIRTHGLVREHISTKLLSSVPLWQELLQNMPMTAMLRNLGKMSAIDLLKEGNEEETIVVSKLTNQQLLKEARIHPFNVLLALKTYERGRGDKGKLTWQTTSRIRTALDKAYHLSFKFVQPTNKRYLLAVDVSGSMCCPVMGSAVINCRTAAAAMMMVTRRTETDSEVVAFCDNLKKMDIRADDTLDKITEKMNRLPFGGTDCALPMIWARKNNKKFDVFVVYTDCETWYGTVHPAEALRQYRKWSGLWDARLIVCGMSSNEFTIANPDDPGMLDVVGFDSAAPEAMRAFVMGEI